MRKNLNKGMAVFMAIAIIALNFGLMGSVLADELGNDQSFALPTDNKPAPDRGSQVTPLPQPVSAPEQGGGGGGSLPVVNLFMPTQESCTLMMANMTLAQNSQSVQGAVSNDLNGDGNVNLTDVILSTQLDLGGPNGDGNTDGVINLTDVVLLTQKCATFLPTTTTPTSTPPITEPEAPVTPVASNNSGGGHGGNAPMFTPLVTNPIVTSPIVTPQVLGEKIVECKNKANTTLTKFADGTLVRGCGPQVYIMKNGQKMYIPNLETLRSKYFGKKILNIGDLINSIKDWSTKIAVK